MKKRRMDELLVLRGLASSVDEARRLIMAGLSIANDKRVDKAGELIPEDAVVRLKNRCQYVGRGGLKLKHAVDVFHLDMKGVQVLDIGSSTGGFTDVCLQEGASHVTAVDSGTAQLHNKLLTDSRVKSFEQTNFRYFKFEETGIHYDFIVTDVSFISLRVIIPETVKFCKDGTIFIALIKPQFEAEREEVEDGGIVNNKEVHRRVIKDIVDCGIKNGYEFKGVIKSPITGTKGNIEYLSYFVYKGSVEEGYDINMIERAVDI